MAMIAKHVFSREGHLRNAHGADENAAGACDKRNTSRMVPRQILKASRSVVTENYAEIRSISLGGDTHG